MNPSVLRSLRHRSFALLWTGQTISRLGDHLYQIALAWWVLEKTGSAAMMGTVLIVGFVPMLLFLLVGGVAVDRFHRPRVMFLSDLGRGVVVTAVAWLAYAGTLEVWQVLVASVLFGFIDAFFQPAYVATVPEVTPAEDLPSANALTSISMQAGRIVGPAIGAGIVALGGTPLAFGLNALSFFVAGAFLAPLLRLPQPEAAPGERQSALAELRAGFGLVRAVPWLSILVSAFGNIGLSGPYSVSMPFLVSDSMHADVGTLGLLYAAFPIGYILGGLWIGRQVRPRHRGRLAYTGSVLAGLFLAAFALPLPLWALLVCALINGAALEVFGVIWISTMQEMVPQNMLGRVASIDQIGSFALLPVGYAVAGWATDALAAGFAIPSRQAYNALGTRHLMATPGTPSAPTRVANPHDLPLPNPFRRLHGIHVQTRLSR